MIFCHVAYISICIKYCTCILVCSNGSERLCPGDCFAGDVRLLFRGNFDADFPCLMTSEANIQGNNNSPLNGSDAYYYLHLEQSKTECHSFPTTENKS